MDAWAQAASPRVLPALPPRVAPIAEALFPPVQGSELMPVKGQTAPVCSPSSLLARQPRLSPGLGDSDVGGGPRAGSSSYAWLSMFQHKAGETSWLPCGLWGVVQGLVLA